MIELAATGIVYRNPKPFIKSIHAWHPTLVHLGDGEILAGFDLAEAISATNYRSYVSRSTDEGETWSDPVRLAPGHTDVTDFIRLSRLSDGTIIGVGVRKEPDEENQGWNPETYGCREGEWFTIRTSDKGVTWSDPVVFDPTFTGQPYELCHAIVEVSDGRLLLPTGLVRTWEGDAPHGLMTIAMVSHDHGVTWPDYIELFSDPEGEVLYHEVSLIELPGGGLLTVAWPFNPSVGQTVLKVPFAAAPDGKQFTVRGSTEIPGETTKLVSLGDNRVLALLRCTDKPGLWAYEARLEGDQWINEAETPVWQGSESRMFGETAAAAELAALHFGFPNMIRLPDGDVLGAFWCREDCIHNIRWLRIRVG